MFTLLDPGLTTLRGRMIQYMNGPKLQLAKLNLLEGKMSKKEFLQATASAIKSVKTATQCFEDYHLIDSFSSNK